MTGFTSESSQASDIPERFRWKKIYQGIALLSLWAVQCLLFLPAEPFFAPSEPDSSWMMAMHWAWLNRVDFGHDLLFSYGPWAFACHGYHPQTFALASAVWVFFASVFFAGAVRLTPS